METGAAPDQQAVKPALLVLRGVTKAFGTFKAVDSVDLDVAAGEIHAILGENGAGKSTLMKILYGSLRPNSGELIWLGRSISLSGPAQARGLGIGMVFQHFSLFENMNVADNVAVALGGAVPLDDIAARIRAMGEKYRLPIDPERMVWSLSAGERQRVEIVRCLIQEPRLLILDEPTSVLTPQEADVLFETLERLRADGVAILYISHKLDEVRRLCDRATILRRGKVVERIDPRISSAREIARLMVGVEVADVTHEPARASGEDVLTVAPADGRSVTLHVKAGEIIGIAGVAGNGQDALFARISGEATSSREEDVVIAGRPVGRLSIEARRRLGAAFIPEERLGHGAVPGHTLSQNVALARHGESGLSRAGIIDWSFARRLSARVREKFDVRAHGRDPAARTLSGGNLQKFVVGRELDRKPALIVVNQPTWGVDAAAAALIRQRLVDAAETGGAVLVISQDLDELFEIADRIAVISEGAISEAFPRRSLTRETVGLMMIKSGAHHTDVRDGL